VTQPSMGIQVGRAWVAPRVSWGSLSTTRRLPRSMTESKPPATFIADLRPNRVATVEGVVVQLEGAREITGDRGPPRKVRNAKLKDKTSEIALVLWGDEVELVSEGDRILITEGWVRDYKGRAQISLGRTGKLTKLPALPTV
jgi:ssDNA-binding replication factor A large subunit